MFDAVHPATGSIFHAALQTSSYQVTAAILEALVPLRELRRGQAKGLYKEFVGPDGYRRGESKDAFLSRNGSGPGPVDPATVPYYVLIVADPQSVP